MSERTAEPATVPVLRLPRAAAPAAVLASAGAAPATGHRLSRRDSWRRRTLAAADALALTGAYVASRTIAPAPAAPADQLQLLIPLAGWLVVNKLLGLYDRDDKVVHQSTLDELPKLLHSVTLGALTLFLLAPVLDVAVPRDELLAFLVAALVAVPVARTLARASVRHCFEAERCVILGGGELARLMARKLQMHPEYGVQLVGYLDDPAGRGGAGTPAAPLLGQISDLASLSGRHGIERVIVASTTASNEQVLGIIEMAKRARLKVTVVPRLYEAIGRAVEIDEVEGMTVLSLRGLCRSRSSLMLKRAIDIVGAGLGLLLLAPLLALISVAIKLDSAGPVLYRQRRMGRDDAFDILKFRSMVDGADELKPTLLHLNEADGIMFKIADDPRITRTGRLLRRAFLDELPQLWNVLRGEMSLVGPRPLVPDEDDHVLGWHRSRLELTPGLTGPWQVAGRTRVPFQEMVKMDYLYVAEWSLWTDLRLLMRTLPIVLLGRGH
jgi:exopolysaccharide biosynthesis polyprenyl glycosylphosphotransferase